MNSSHTLTIGISGTRKLNDEQAIKLEPLLKGCISAIIARAGNGKTIVGISPLAKGADILFAETILTLNYRLKVYLPFEKEEYRTDFEGAEDALAKFDKLYKNIPEEDKTEINSITENDRDRLYMEVGKKVVHDADYLVAIWNELPGFPGGTADVVRHLLEHNENEYYKPVHERKLKGIVSINIAGNEPVVAIIHPNEKPDTKLKNLPLALYNNKVHHDQLSQKYKKQYEHVWKWCLWLGLFAAGFFALNIGFHPHDEIHMLFSLAEFVSVISILILIARYNPKATHRTFLLHRFTAEQVRVLSTSYWAGIRLNDEPDNPMFTAIKNHHRWNSEDLDQLNDLKQLFKNKMGAAGTGQYRKEPVQALVEEQLSYHHGRFHVKEKEQQNSDEISKWLVNAFIVILVVHFFAGAFAFLQHYGIHPKWCICKMLHYVHEGIGYSVVLFLLVFLPALIARREAIKVFRESEKLSLQSLAMETFFAIQKERIGKEQLPDIMNDISKQMYYENLEWQLYMLDKEPPGVS